MVTCDLTCPAIQCHIECNQRLDLMVTEMRGTVEHISKSGLLHLSMLLPRYLNELDQVSHLFLHEETKYEVVKVKHIYKYHLNVLLKE